MNYEKITQISVLGQLLTDFVLFVSVMHLIARTATNIDNRGYDRPLEYSK